jgi:dUTP pyrophosphatase
MLLNVMLDDGAFMPTKAHESDAGFDLRTPRDCFVPEYGNATIDTGVHIAIPSGYVGMLKSKSGLNVKHDLVSEGVIDAGYTGSIVVKLYNHGNEPYKFERGDKITQLVIMPIPNVTLAQVTEFADTERGDNGFGSSGR